MAEIKVSEMPEANNVNDEDLIMIIQNGVNKKVPAKEVGTGAKATGDTLPIGAIIPYSSDNIPDNWLLADGRAVSRTTYKNLFDVIGVTYGSGDGNTTFNLPNLKGKIPVGQDEESIEFAPLAMEGGEKTHTLTIEEMPNHRHNVYGINEGLSAGEIRGGHICDSQDANYIRETSHSGENQPHNNLQPYLVTNYIIKAAQSSGLVATVVDNLESDSEIDALSAKQGKVLNEKINNLSTYSTEETLTGKTWIDGKPIYRKVITGTLNQSGSKTIANLSGLNYKTIIKLNIISNNSDPISSQFYDSTTSFMRCYIIPANKNLTISIGSSYPTIPLEYTIILEYTKTTD